MQEKMREKGFWLVILAGILISVLVSGCEIPEPSPPKEFSLPETFLTKDGNWKVTVDSCQFLEGERLQFNLLIENLQEQVKACFIWGGSPYTHLLDNLTNKYDPQDISIGDSSHCYGEFIPHIPTKAYVTFPALKEGAKSVVLNLYFYHGQYAGEASLVGKWEVGPIKLAEVPLANKIFTLWNSWKIKIIS